MDSIKEQLKDINIDIRVATEMSCDREKWIMIIQLHHHLLPDDVK